MAQAIRRNNIEARQARRKNRGELLRNVVNVMAGAFIVVMFFAAAFVAEPIAEMISDATSKVKVSN